MGEARPSLKGRTTDLHTALRQELMELCFHRPLAASLPCTLLRSGLAAGGRRAAGR